MHGSKSSVTSGASVIPVALIQKIRFDNSERSRKINKLALVVIFFESVIQAIARPAR